MNAAPDLILHHAQALTLDPARPRASLVAVKGERILWVGETADLKAIEHPESRLVDCQGLTLLPGFHDAHLHFLALASSLLEVDASSATSLAHLLAQVQEQAQATPYGHWVRAQGYHEFNLQEKRHPTCWELDSVAPHHPVRLAHRTGHAWVLNSRALARAGITQEWEPPEIGHVERDGSGEPTGLILEPRLSLLPPLSWGELREGVRRAVGLLLSSGITSFQDATVSNDRARWRLFKRLQKQGELPLRVTLMSGSPEALPPGNMSLSRGPAKIILDETGPEPAPPQEELDETVFRRHQAGYQVAIHAVEEAGIAAATLALERAQARHPRPDHRHRIEHCSQCPHPLQERLGRLRVVVATQPSFLYFNGERYQAQVPPEKQPWLYPLASLRRAGLALAGSSDAPVAGPNPALGLYAAVTRRSLEGKPLNPEEGLTPLQALEMYTLGAAHAIFREFDLGSITPGKLADFILVDRDPTLDPEAFPDLQVLKVFIGGELAWEA